MALGTPNIPPSPTAPGLTANGFASRPASTPTAYNAGMNRMPSGYNSTLGAVRADRGGYPTGSSNYLGSLRSDLRRSDAAGYATGSSLQPQYNAGPRTPYSPLLQQRMNAAATPQARLALLNRYNAWLAAGRPGMAQWAAMGAGYNVPPRIMY